MAAILSKAGCFVVIIILGFCLRRAGFFREEDFRLLSRIVLRITLPASIVYSFSGKEIEASMLLLCLLGFGFGIVYIAVGYVTAGKGNGQRAFSVLNLSGYNIGNFTMPFAQGFLGATGVITTSLFDTGNAFICLGMSYSVAAMIQRGEKVSFRKIGRDLLHSIPFVTYVLMATLTLLHIRLPQPMTELAGLIGNANAFLAMLMLGVGFRVSGDRNQIRTIVKLLSIRYALASAIAMGCYFLLPVGQEIRKTLVILAFSPIASAAPAYTGELGGDTGLSSAVNSLSIVISLICIVAILLILM